MSALDDLAAGTSPSVTLGPSAGVGATYAIAGSRHLIRLFIKTGTNPVRGDIVALLSYNSPAFVAPPLALSGPATDRSAEAGFYVQGSTTSGVVVRTAGDIQPKTEYVLDILVLGVSA